MKRYSIQAGLLLAVISLGQSVAVVAQESAATTSSETGTTTSISTVATSSTTAQSVNGKTVDTSLSSSSTTSTALSTSTDASSQSTGSTTSTALSTSTDASSQSTGSMEDADSTETKASATIDSSQASNESLKEALYASNILYRLYHPGLKTHLYTKDKNEYQVLGRRGWNQEGKAWQFESSGRYQPVYRLYHSGLKVHLYTIDVNEYNVLATRGWRKEGVSFYSFGSIKVYRLYHEGIKRHLYTKDVNEYNTLGKVGWRQEGVAFSAFDPTNIAGQTPPTSPSTPSSQTLQQALKDLATAQADLTKAKADETKAQNDLTKAQTADAKKASDIASLTQTQTQQQATANQTAAALATAQANAKTKADAKTAADNKVAELTAQIDAIENMTVPTLSQDVIDAYKKFVNASSQTNKDALFDAINTWYTTDMVGYTKTMVTPIDTTVVDPANLTEEQVTALSQYYVYIENAVRRQIWGANNENVIVTKDAVQAAMQIAKNYTAENDNTGDHSSTALKNDGNSSVSYNSEGISFISTKTTTMTELYRKIYRMSIDTWAGDYTQDYAHITNEYWYFPRYAGSGTVNIQTSGAFVTSVTPGGFGRAHTIQFADKGGNTIAAPYDTTALKAELATAKTTQAQATQADNQAQSTLASATTANNQAQSALQATTTQLNTLKATADQTPAAQAKLTVATATRQAAETRLANAQAKVDALTRKKVS